MDETNDAGQGPGDRNAPKALDTDEAERVAHYSRLLETFLHEVFKTVEGLQQDVRGLTVSTKKRPDEILSLLPQILQFEQMSLLEVQYVLSGTSKRPGIRFWLEGPQRDKRLRAVLFEDTRIWDVSYDLEKIYTELGSFFLEESEIVAHPAAALAGKPAAGSNWRAVLRTVLRAPIPRLHAGEKTMNIV
jgi:hypothetical protein